MWILFVNDIEIIWFLLWFNLSHIFKYGRFVYDVRTTLSLFSNSHFFFFLLKIDHHVSFKVLAWRCWLISSMNEKFLDIENGFEVLKQETVLNFQLLKWGMIKICLVHWKLSAHQPFTLQRSMRMLLHIKSTPFFLFIVNCRTLPL